jgi:RND family efflux transporter MFP subunit
MRKIRLIATLIFLFGGVVVLAAMAVHKAKEKAGQKPPARPQSAAPVEVAPVTVGTIRDERALFGSLAARSQFVAAAKVSGRLASLEARVGDAMERGQIVARLDDEELREAVEGARSALTVARARLAEAQSSVQYADREHQRAQELSGQSIASQSSLDAAKLELQIKQAQVSVMAAEVAQAEAALRAAEIRRSYAEVRAAWTEGDSKRVVGERFADEGDLLAPNDPIVSVLDIDALIAVVFVTEKDYPRLHLGQTAILRADPFPDREWLGEIARIAPMFRESSRQARLEIRVPNADWTLKPGMFIRASILLEERHNANIIPRDALAKRREGQGVFLVSDDKSTARFVPVKTGIIEGERVEIVEPANLSGLVVTLGQNLLDDGSAILIANDPANAAPANPLAAQDAPQAARAPSGAAPSLPVAASVASMAAPGQKTETAR